MHSLTKKLLQVSHALWLARNDIAHEKDDKGRYLAEGQSITEGITACYAQGPASLLVPDRFLLEERSLDSLLAETAVEQYLWLARVKQSQSLHSQAENTGHAKMRRSFIAHFPPTNAPT